MLLLLACTGSQTIASDTSASDSGGRAGDSSADSTAAVDLDSDGYDAAVDCNDTNPLVHPEAKEVWDQVDDDCDGAVDANGPWTGTIAVEASAVYEGKSYAFSLTCPFVGTRDFTSFPWTVECTPDPTDDKAQLLLGASLAFAPDDPTVPAGSWEGSVIVTSSDGWDTEAAGSLEWTTFTKANVQWSLAARSLTLSASGSLTPG